MNTIELPLGLRHAIEGGNCVLFVGAGVGCHLRTPEGTVAPDGRRLAEELASQFSIDAGGQFDLTLISSVVELKRGRKELEAFLKTRLADLEPDQTLQWLTSLRWRAIYTTNYDRSIQRAYELNSQPPQTPVTHVLSRDVVSYDPKFQVPIIHLHGALFGVENPRIVITENDYLNFKEKRRMLFELLRRDAATSTILYIGYSNRDPNWRLVMDELRSEFLPAHPPPSYRVAPSTSSVEKDVLASLGVETVDASLEDCVKALQLSLVGARVEVDQLKILQSSVPTDLLSAFEHNPAATVRLVNSWVYVNQAAFDTKANLGAFLQGDRANWALIGNQNYFQRDLEEQLYEESLDFATSMSKRPAGMTVLAPAGYGITTMLMALAVRLVKERAGPVFFLRPGAAATEGDIDFACSLFEAQRPFFFVDNASEHRFVTRNAFQRLKDKQRVAMIVCGERLNEWRQVGNSPSAMEYAIEPLSDPEITRLIAFLGKHSALGVLQELKPELQVAAIRNKHNKELLVVMREATEGRGFDAILEDEFRGIQDELSRRLYLTVCGFYQYGALVRVPLLATLLGVSEPELYSATGNATDGVVMYECIDQGTGVHAARARHRRIAEVVWERCGEKGEKERILQAALSLLNLNYGADKAAFERFVRSDHLVDAITTLDGKIRYFETACKKDPESPYVRQHFARMLSREEKPELALGQIEEAITLNPRVRVLYHTKGKVLSDLALCTESRDIARKRMAQSEAAFRYGLSLKRDDEYCYQGLAELYFGWARRADDEAEMREYLERTESLISEGLRHVRVREGLWIISSYVARFIGDSPTHIQALERAVKESPGSIVARYLLGRTYRKAGDADKAITVLEPVVKNHPDEFRACAEYARALLITGEPYSKAIAILRLGNLYGFSDPRYIATLGGLLFLNGEFTEADKVFAESDRQALSSAEKNTPEFRPKQCGSKEALRLRGNVVAVRTALALIEATGYPQFLCPGSKWSGTPMRPGMKVDFELVFCPRGPVAVNPVEVPAVMNAAS